MTEKTVRPHSVLRRTMLVGTAGVLGGAVLRPTPVQSQTGTAPAVAVPGSAPPGTRYGDPAFTYVDVEATLCTWLHGCGILAQYERLAQSEIHDRAFTTATALVEHLRPQDREQLAAILTGTAPIAEPRAGSCAQLDLLAE